jgi:glycerate-2-kinase
VEFSNRKIQNFESLSANSSLRRVCLQIAEAGLRAIDTKSAIQNNVFLQGSSLKLAGESIDLSRIRRLLVIGIGKCALEAASSLEQILGNKISGGVVVDVREGKLKKLRAFSGTHPFPSEKNIAATKEIINTLGGLTNRDLVIFIISGGGSTLLCQPRNMTCEEEEILLKCMFSAGAGIREINVLRKHLSLARGGYLSAYAYPARVISLIFSDVPGVEPEFVASGPTMKDATTLKEAKQILAKYEIEKLCGVSEDSLIETPKDEKYFINTRSIVIVSNQISLEAMRQTAESLGYRVKIDPIGLNGESKDRAVAMLEALADSGPGSAILWGGESTVTMQKPFDPSTRFRVALKNLKGDAAQGKGGRNLEFALSALRGIQERQIIVSIASDGRDNTDFAGGISDSITLESTIRLQLDIDDFLASHSSYDFFERTGDYIMTGDTGSNIADLAIGLSGNPKLYIANSKLQIKSKSA